MCELRDEGHSTQRRSSGGAPSPRSRRPAGLLLGSLLVFGAALALRLAYARSLPVPFSGDSDYYAMVGENLYRGRGLVADYVWNYFAGIPRGLPAPSNAYWMPGPSVAIAAAFHLAGSASERAAQLPSVFFDAVLCALTAVLGIVVFRRRDVALLAAALCTVSFGLVAVAAYPDPFTMSGVFVNLCLLALWAAARTAPSWGVVAGVCGGLAYLTRSDGVLLVGAAVIVATDLALRERQRRRAAVLLLSFALALLIVVGPWLMRQNRVFGSPTGGSMLRTAFASDLSDIFRLDLSALNLGSYLDANPHAQVGFKTYVLCREILVLGQLVGPMLLLAWIPLQGRSLRRELLPWLSYTALALVLPAYLVPHLALSGTFAHIGTGLTPILCLLGAKAALDLLSARRTEGEPAWQRLRWVPLAAAVAWFPVWWWFMLPREIDLRASWRYPAAARQVCRDLTPRAALSDMSWGLWNTARVPCAQFPTEGADAALRVADAIDADYLITMADAFRRLPALREVEEHDRFGLVARYPASPVDLLVYRILPPNASGDDSRTRGESPVPEGRIDVR